MDKESQLDEIEGWAANPKWSQPGTGNENVILPKVLFQRGGEIYEMRRREQQLQEEVENLVQSLKVADSDLEAAHQANSKISKHNQELSKENERLRQDMKQKRQHFPEDHEI